MVAYLWEEMWGYMPLNRKGYTVADNLSFYKMWLVTYSIFQLQYHGSIPWVNEYHGWILQYHRRMPFTIPWVNSMGRWIIWVDEYHGWILQYHGRMSFTIPWVNSMGWWIIWVDEYHGLMPFSIRIIPPSLRSNGPHCVKFPPAKPLWNMKSHWR